MPAPGSLVNRITMRDLEEFHTHACLLKHREGMSRAFTHEIPNHGSAAHAICRTVSSAYIVLKSRAHDALVRAAIWSYSHAVSDSAHPLPYSTLHLKMSFKASMSDFISTVHVKIHHKIMQVAGDTSGFEGAGECFFWGWCRRHA